MAELSARRATERGLAARERFDFDRAEMKLAEVIVLLLCASIGVVFVGARLRIPYPIALVIGGLGISLLPGLGGVRLDPEVIFLLFLPPLLFAAAWQTSLHDFKANLRPIVLLGVGLVLFTTVTVGAAVHLLIPEVPWAAAFALGAIISPPDAIAATAIARRTGLPGQIITILEGESLVNDATGLVALRFAIAAAMSGTFSLGAAAATFFWVALGGVAIGLAAGWLFTKLVSYLKDDALIITATLLTPFLAYLSAERIHVSGVLAVVAAGLYGSWRAPELISASTRITAFAFWDSMVFLLNCAVFILIGLQLPAVIRELGRHSRGELIVYAVIVSAVLIIVRPLWVFPAAVLSRILNRRVRRCDPVPPRRHLVILSWAGMRGVVSLAAALALPRTLENGSEFPERGLIIYLSFAAILATLVVQGLSLPYLIRRLHVTERHDGKEERTVRLKLAHAALADLNRLGEKDHVNEGALRAVTAQYLERVGDLTDEQAEVLGWSDQRERLIATRRLRRRALQAERRELLQLRRRHELHEELMRRIEHEIDLEELRLGS